MSRVSSSKSQERIFYVYVLLDPRKPGSFCYSRWKFPYEPFYVGKGHGNRYLRHEQSAANSSTRNYLFNKIRKLFKEGWSGPEIVVKRQFLSEPEAFSLEKRLVKAIGRKDLDLGPLLNLTDGGDGAVGKRESRRGRTLRSERMKEWNSSMTEEYRKKFLESLSIGVKRSHALRTPEERKAQSQKISTGLSAMSKRAKDKRIKSIAESNRIHYANLTTAEKEALAEKKRQGRLNIDPAVEREANQKRSIASKKMHENRSSRETERLRKIWSERRSASWANRTPEQLEATRLKMSKSAKLRCARQKELSHEQR